VPPAPASTRGQSREGGGWVLVRALPLTGDGIGVALADGRSAAPMDRSTAILAGAGLGAGLMYLLDPDTGRRRRALTRDRLVHATHVAGHAAGAAGRDLAHRAAGAAARIRGRVKHEEVDDTVLVERVRARLGHLVSHPGALEVHAS